MPKTLSSREVEKILKQNGFLLVSQKGSHGKFRKSTGKEVRTVILPLKKKFIPAGTLMSVVRQSGLDRKIFT